MLNNRLSMCAGSVPLMRLKRVRRVLRRKPHHESVSFNLGGDGGQRNNGLRLIATDDGGLTNVFRWRFEAAIKPHLANIPRTVLGNLGECAGECTLDSRHNAVGIYHRR